MFVFLDDLIAMITVVRIMKTSQVITTLSPVISDFILRYLGSKKNQRNMHIENCSANIVFIYIEIHSFS